MISSDKEKAKIKIDEKYKINSSNNIPQLRGLEPYHDKEKDIKKYKEKEKEKTKEEKKAMDKLKKKFGF